MSKNLWNNPGIPHKGWTCINTADLGADTEPGEEIEYATCEMCGNEKIRYLHIMHHPEFAEILEVGCVCAGKMSNDYEGARTREANLRNRAACRSRWLNRKWRTSSKGNSFINIKGYNLVIFHRGIQYKYSINGNFSKKAYATEDEAKLALFEEFWSLTQDIE